jgi:(R,R)-butanediol dehydrogenase / meso-butanediol dehydrogenase / diacetyl reductase
MPAGTRTDTTRQLILHAEDAPLPGIVQPGTHQRYRHPRLAIETRQPGTLQDGYLRVEMAFAGICGTDVHMVQTDPVSGYVRSSAPAEIPSTGRVIGHEGVGRVVECGHGCRHVHPGDWVCFESIVACHHCVACRCGDFNQCHQARLLGMQVDGLFGNFVDLPASLAHVVTDLAESSSRLPATACVEPAGVAWLALENARIKGGDNLLIFGGGPIGQYCAMIARLFCGAARIVLIDPEPRRRKLADVWCDETLSPEEFRENSRFSCDVLIEASGCLDNVSLAFRQIRANGRVILLARSGMPLTIAAVDHMITQAISIQGVRGHLGGVFDRILCLYRAGRMPLDAVITRTLDGLDELLAWLQHPERIVREECKILVRLGATE